jgi:hypothetical protein
VCRYLLSPFRINRYDTNTGGGEREKIFWRNYFFHCAYTRYEAGLSIDEIWSEDQPTSQEAVTEGAEKTAEEETINFDQAKKDEAKSAEKAFPADPETDSDAPFSTKTERGSEPSTTPDSVSTDYEMIGSEGDVGAAVEESVPDYELDALEAEIAKELED